MKVYYIRYLQCDESGAIEAFTSRTKANKRIAEIKRNKEFSPSYDLTISETEFDINATGIIQALEFGASIVIK